MTRTTQALLSTLLTGLLVGKPSTVNRTPTIRLNQHTEMTLDHTVSPPRVRVVAPPPRTAHPSIYLRASTISVKLTETLSQPNSFSTISIARVCPHLPPLPTRMASLETGHSGGDSTLHQCWKRTQKLASSSLPPTAPLLNRSSRAIVI